MKLTAGNNDNKVSVGCICDAEMWKIYIYITVFLVMIITTSPAEFRLRYKGLKFEEAHSVWL